MRSAYTIQGSRFPGRMSVVVERPIIVTFDGTAPTVFNGHVIYPMRHEWSEDMISKMRAIEDAREI